MSRQAAWFRPALAFAIAWSGALLVLLPVLWLILTSLKLPRQVLLRPDDFLPNPLDLGNYARAWQAAPFATYYLNTVLIVALSTIGVLVSNSLGAYAFARIRAPGRDLLFALLLGTLMLPGIVTFLPEFVGFSWLGWVDTWLPLIVPSFFGSALYTFLLRQFFQTIPIELEEAAFVDGMSRLGIFWQIILPLSRSALLATAILHVVWTWHDFFGPYVYLVSDEKKTLSVALVNLLGSHGSDWPLLLAAATTATIPLVILFSLGQRWFVSGIVTTGFGGR